MVSVYELTTEGKDIHKEMREKKGETRQVLELSTENSVIAYPHQQGALTSTGSH
jgi:hypothetical protein